MATVSGWWEPVSEIEITSRQWAEMRESVRLATEQGKALITAAGVSLVWHPAPGSLDAAWAEAEAARPEGWFIGIESGWPISAEQPDGYRAVASRDQTYLFDGPSASGEGPTPAAALRALAAKLREVPR